MKGRFVLAGVLRVVVSILVLSVGWGVTFRFEPASWLAELGTLLLRVGSIVILYRLWARR